MARALVLGLVVALVSAETVRDCVEAKCRGCGGEQCQLCREDKSTISACVSSCMDTICKGCGGEQCQLCREDANTLSSCCSGTEGIDICKAESKDPCDGLYGAAGLQCAWEQDAKSCIETKCHGCGGEQCQLCREDANTIAGCCDDHYHSVDPPKMCIDSKEEAVNSCFDSKCHGCGGEQCGPASLLPQNDINKDQVASPRLFKSHLRFKSCPEDVKRIYCFRDIKDVLVSDWTFTASILESDVPLDTCRQFVFFLRV
ncbi:unnamed protein product [Symbiodinium microadriaticum]|nr:unnamed protein product [Symbiodinium microadriaticum]